MKIIRNNSTYPGLLNGLQVLCGTFTNGDGGASHTLIVETQSTEILFHIAYAGTTVIAGTIATSTAYPATKKITWTIPTSGVGKWLIICSDGSTLDVATASVDTTLTDVEVY